MTSRNERWRSATERIRRTMTPRGRSESGLFSIEGIRLHQRALRSGCSIDCSLVAEGIIGSEEPRVRQLLAELERAGTEIVTAPDDELQKLTGGRSIGALVGLMRRPADPDLDALLGSSGSSPAILLVAVEVDDPGNVGALVRTGLATGALGFVGVGCSDPYHPRAVRTSMGSLFRLPTLRYPTLDEALSELKRHGIETIAATSTGGRTLPETRFPAPRIAVLLGSEAFGLPDEAVAAATWRVSVPMAERVDSLSVNAAAAIVMYHLLHGRLLAN